MICPKCKTQNADDAIVCEKCGFKLKLKCPHCNTYNPIGAKVCSSCGKQLLKVCPKCKAVNFANAKVCRKCSAPFEKINNSSAQSVSKADTNALPKSASLAVELINISSIKTNIKSEAIATKVISKFYQIFAKEAKSNGLKPLKVNENTLVVSFEQAPSFADSVNIAVDFVATLDNSIDEVSRLLDEKLKISYKTRYLVSTYKPTEKNNIISSISLGIVDDVVFSNDVYELLKDKMAFEEIEKDDGQKFYKFLDESKIDTSADMANKHFSKSRMDVINEMLAKVQLAKNGFVACLNGPLGIGKSNIFGALRMTFEEDNSNIWLLGQCSLQAKNAPLFFFKDVLQNLFDIPAFNIDLETTKNRVYTFLSDKLNIVDDELVKNIFAVLFFDEERLTNSIYDNKQKTYKAISEIFRAILGRANVILQIEDIENIDSFSLEILRSLFQDGILQCNLKIFITSNIETDIVQFFASPNLNSENSFFANYPYMNKEEIDDFIIKAIGVRKELGSNILNHIYEYSQGLPIFVEEFLYLLLQLGLVRFTDNAKEPVVVAPEISKFTFPKTVQEIIQLRITNISNVNPMAFKMLYYSSILGFKFLPAVVQNILQVNENDFVEIKKFLSMNNFITSFDTYNCIFKNRMIWETVRNLNISLGNKVTGVKNTMATLTQLTMPDMATVVNNMLDVSVPKYELINEIEQATKEAYVVGDAYSYVYHKSLLLEAVEISTLENKNEIMTSIKIELVNLTYMTFPTTAIKYADELLAYFETIDTAKTIDILGLMSVAFENTGNYLASLECVDKALEKIDSTTNRLSVMLLKYSKLNSILQLGRYEELNNLIQNDILPVIADYYKEKIPEVTSLTMNNVKSIELETRYLYAMATTLQGSTKATELIQTLYSVANEAQNNEYMVKSQLLNGILKLLQCEIEEVETILASVKEVIPQTKDAQYNTLFWLIISNLSRYFKGDYTNIANNLFMIANFSQNLKQFALEPVIRALLSKLALREGNLEFAQNLSYEQYYKCANNQWALGALINWYMYCEISIYKESYDDALKVAQNALDVAEKATINNIFFTALLKLKIAQIYSLRNDLDMAKINLQEAIQLAEENNYIYIKALSGNIYYDILLKQIAANPQTKAENINLLYKQLLYSQEAVLKLKNPDISVQLKQNIEAIVNYGKENGIDLA